MNAPSPDRPKSSFQAPIVGCVAGGCVIPLLWMIVGGILMGGGSSGWGGIYILAILLAPLGFFCGLLVHFWRDRQVTLSDDALRAELQSMPMESLIEYKTLCPPTSREHTLATAELARRATPSEESAGQNPPQT